MELHDGTIDAHSAGPGRGSKFVVRLPLPRIAATTLKLRPATRQNKTAKSLTGVKVLLLEDSPQAAKAMVKLLVLEGASVFNAGSAAEAEIALTKSRFDLIVSDIAMPDKDGYTFMRELRAAELAAGTPPMPALALSAFTREADRRQALDAGFQNHLGKPVDFQSLIEVLVKMLPPK